MLNHSSQSHETLQPPDPWEGAPAPQKAEASPPRNLEPAAQPLISPVPAPEAVLAQTPEPPVLPAPEDLAQLESAKILLQDELKLPARTGKLWERLRDALALLWWKPE